MALEKYEASIEAARDHRFVHEEGLAYEKAATYHLNKGRNKEALDYFAQAEKCYERWGAHTLVNRIRNATMVLDSKCRTVHQNEAKNA